MTPEEALQRVDLDVVDGLTFSGGEPMEQAPALAVLAKQAKERKDLSLICFTGYRYERLLSAPPNPGVQDLLGQVDVLIDGPYIQSKNDSTGLRGSSNQRILYLTPRLRNENLESQNRRIEVSISEGELAFIGIPTPEMRTVMDRAIHEAAERKRKDERL